MKYRVYYDRIYREKESVIITAVTDVISAKSDSEALKKAQKFIRERNKHTRLTSERYELDMLLRIVQEAQAEKVIPITIPLTIPS